MRKMNKVVSLRSKVFNFILFFSLFFSTAYAQSTIDFSTAPAVESDPTNTITLNPTCVTFSNLETANTNSYVYKPVASSGDFTYEFDTVLNAADTFAGELLIWGVTNTSNASINLQADGFQLAWKKASTGGNAVLKLRKIGTTWVTSTNLALNQRFYIRIKRVGTTLTAYIYSNPQRTTLVDTLTRTSVSIAAFSNLYALSADNGSTANRKATGDACNFINSSGVTTYVLSVAVSGTGTGTVTSTPAGINCGGTCNASFNSGTSVTLSPAAGTGSSLINWTGACTGSGACSVTMDAAKSVGAVFNDTTAPSVPLNFTAAAASSSQINLSWSASTDTGGSGLKGYNVYKLNGGSYVFLKQVLAPATTTSDTGLNPSTPYSYKISSIDNANNESAQSGVATATTSATSTFALTVSISGTGTGTVTSTPAGINCGATCNASFNSGTSVTLTPAAGTGSSFINWTGACLGSGACSVTMDAAKSVGAVFNDTTAPSVPTLNATAVSSSQIDLSWNASTDTGGSGLKGYNIYKLNGGSYVFLKQVLTPATTTSDTGLNPSTSYSYKISSIDNANVESAQSGVASATTNSASGGLPSPWTNADIGAVAAAGNASYNAVTQTFTINGSGADIYGTADEFQYVYQLVTGDIEIIAKVESLTNTNPWAKAGVMFRETLNNNAKNIMMTMTTGNGASFQRRTTTGGTSSQNSSPTALPYWVKLKRQGDSFSGYKSSDGVIWTQVGSSVTVTMAAQVYVGLAVTSHNDGVLTSAVFTNVSAGPIPTFALTVNKIGSGTGTVSSTPAGINCGTTCTASFSSGTSVALSKTPGTGMTFAGWTGGGCSGTGACSVTMDAAKSVNAQFNDTSAPVQPTGANITNVLHNGFTLNWSATTDNVAVTGYKIDISAFSNFSTFVPGYNGADVGFVLSAPVTGLSPSLKYYARVKAYDAAGNVSTNSASVNATTNALPSYTLTINKLGSGTGTVSSVPAGINCGLTCNFNYTSGTVVTLTASAASGAAFSGWTGACTNVSGTCQVTVDAAKTVNAIFNSLTVTIDYGYDDLNRLNTVGNGSTVTTYQYDEVGNTTNKSTF